MTTAFDNEIDRLLRRHTPGASISHSGSAGDHLDADTLALYVEQALPPRTQAAHTEHLAACDDCRASLAMLARLHAPEDKTVTAEASSPITLVAPAVGVSAATEEDKNHASAPDAAPRRGWQSIWRELFATPRLAYALPAVVVLLIVGSVSLLLFIRRTEPETIALVAERDSHSNGAINANTTMNSNIASANMAGANMNMNGNMGTPVDPSTSGASTAASVSTSNAANANSVTPSDFGVPAAPAPPANAAAPSGESASIASSQAQPTGAPSASPQSAGAEREARSTPTAVNNDDELIAREEAREDAPVASSRPVMPAPVSNRARANSALRDNGARAEAADDPLRREKKNVESRTIGDRRFARRGTTWIDEAYVSGSTVTTVARNSEQLRALLADEPGLRRVVETLSGELIVVWKNRAYRIR